MYEVTNQAHDNDDEINLLEVIRLTSSQPATNHDDPPLFCSCTIDWG